MVQKNYKFKIESIKTIDKELCKKSRKWANSLVPTYPSLVFYALVEDSVIPEDTLPIEMLISNTKEIDENEITLYILGKDDLLQKFA